jgi:hypothetical protein
MRSKITVDEKGRVITFGKLALKYYTAEWENMTIPQPFVCKLLNQQTRPEAVKMLNKLHKILPLPDGSKLIFDVVESRGMAQGWKAIEQVINDRPKNKPAFYRSLEPRGRYDESYNITLTDGKTAYRLLTNVNPNHLPANVYCEEESVRIELDESLLKRAEECKEELLAIMPKILTAHQSTFLVPTHEMIKLFLTDRQDFGRQMADYELMAQMFRSALKCKHGYLIYWGNSQGWARCYLVTLQGQIYYFSKRGARELAETALRIAKTGEPIDNLRKFEPPIDERKRLAEQVSKLDPALAVVLLP